MKASAMTLYANDGDFRPVLGLDRSVADALAVWAQQTFPAPGTRKALARHFDISGDEARTILEARPSRGLLDKIWKHKNGGWPVLIPVMGAVVGQSVDAFILNEKARLADERRQYEEREARLDDMARDLRAMQPLRRVG